jgi:hypothetical protein
MIAYITSLLGHVPLTDAVFSASFFIIVSLFIYAHIRKNRKTISPRRIAVFERITTFVDAAIESGRALHLSLGMGAINSSGVVDSTIGLAVLDYISSKTANLCLDNTCTCGEATLYLSTMGAERERQPHTLAVNHPGDNRYYCGPDPLMYANGVIQQLGWSQPQTNLLMGFTGTECLYITGSPATRKIQHVGGTSSPLGAALLHIATGETLVGEEFYATRAYLRRSSNDRSLIVQDWLRYFILFAVIVGVVLALTGYGS